MCDAHEPTSRSRRRFLAGGLLLGGAALAGPALQLPAFAVGDDPFADGDEPIFEEQGGRPPEPTGRLRARSAVPPPPIVPRSAWGADESIVNGTPSHAPVRKFVVHHSASGNNPSDPAATVRAIQRYHVQDRGFFDIAYNYLIDHRGTIYEGRRARAYEAGEVPSSRLPDGRGVVGAHTYNYNTGTMGVCLIGDFMGSRPSQAALDALASLLAWQMAISGVEPLGTDSFTNYAGVTSTFPNITGHRDLTATSCPGDVLYGGVAALRTTVDGLVNGGIAGYWVLGRDGTPNPRGAAAPLGDLRARGVAAAATAMAATRTGRGYWVVDNAGGVHAFGDAGYHGSLPERGLRVLAPGIAPTPSGAGYWVLDEIGGVHAFGDAGYFGSLPEREVDTRAVSIATTPSGGGYWVLDQVGGVHSFGDAGWFGSVPGRGVSAWGVAIAASPSGRGYTVLDHNGGLHVFGDAPFHGSAFGKLSGRRATGLLTDPGGRGYYVLRSDGRVLAFGSVAEHGGTSTSISAVTLAGVLRQA